jgi:hypothetical protein
MGKQVMQQVTGTSVTQLDISKLASGLYLMKIQDGEKNSSMKFVKE